jgi:hypothetical protein
LQCDGPGANYSDIREDLFFQAGDDLVSSQDYCTKPDLIVDSSDYWNNCSSLPSWAYNGSYDTCLSSDSIIYEPYEFSTTIATDFDLVCDQQYKVHAMI